MCFGYNASVDFAVFLQRIQWPQQPCWCYLDWPAAPYWSVADWCYINQFDLARQHKGEPSQAPALTAPWVLFVLFMGGIYAPTFLLWFLCNCDSVIRAGFVKIWLICSVKRIAQVCLDKCLRCSICEVISSTSTCGFVYVRLVLIWLMFRGPTYVYTITVWICVSLTRTKKIFIGVLGLGKLWLCGFVLLRCRYTAVWSSWPHCCFRLPLSLLYRSHFHKAYMHVAPDHQHPAPLWPWWGQSKEDGWNI